MLTTRHQYSLTCHSFYMFTHYRYDVIKIKVTVKVSFKCSAKKIKSTVVRIEDECSSR